MNNLRYAISKRGMTDSDTDAQIARGGEDACNSRRAGGSQATLLGTVHGKGSRLFVTLAERYLCPAYLPRVLLRFSGSGIANSRPFVVPTGTVTVRYSYDCASQGTGNFIANLETAGSLDDESIANALGAGGHQATTVYPQDPGAEYHVSVDSECSWSLVLRNG
ncbi:MAG: hypothetical protein ACRDRJ_03065 [Streptosporangiaceae bacterium]